MNKLSELNIHDKFEYSRSDDILYSTLNDNIIIECPGLHPKCRINSHLKTQISLLSAIPIKIICFTLRYSTRYDQIIRAARDIPNIFQENLSNIIIIITLKLT